VCAINSAALGNNRAAGDDRISEDTCGKHDRESGGEQAVGNVRIKHGFGFLWVGYRACQIRQAKGLQG